MSNTIPTMPSITAGNIVVTSSHPANTITGTSVVSATTGYSTGYYEVGKDVSYKNKTQRIQELINSMDNLQQTISTGTDEENLLVLEAFSKKFLRARDLTNEAIDELEKNKSINIK